jgi:hypothetical protein
MSGNCDNPFYCIVNAQDIERFETTQKFYLNAPLCKVRQFVVGRKPAVGKQVYGSYFHYELTKRLWFSTDEVHAEREAVRRSSCSIRASDGHFYKLLHDSFDQTCFMHASNGHFYKTVVDTRGRIAETQCDVIEKILRGIRTASFDEVVHMDTHIINAARSALGRCETYKTNAITEYSSAWRRLDISPANKTFYFEVMYFIGSEAHKWHVKRQFPRFENFAYGGRIFTAWDPSVLRMRKTIVELCDVRLVGGTLQLFESNSAGLRAMVMDFNRHGGAGWTRSAFPSLHPLNAATSGTVTEIEQAVETAALADELEDAACIDEDDPFATDSSYI